MIRCKIIVVAKMVVKSNEMLKNLIKQGSTEISVAPSKLNKTTEQYIFIMKFLQ